MIIPFKKLAKITDILSSKSLSASIIIVNNLARLPIKTKKAVIKDSDPVDLHFEIS